MNLNKKCFKTTISTVNSLDICWNLEETFTLCQARNHGEHSRAVPPNFIVPRKICFKHIIKTKILSL